MVPAILPAQPIKLALESTGGAATVAELEEQQIAVLEGSGGPSMGSGSWLTQPHQHKILTLKFSSTSSLSYNPACRQFQP
jgi:hypothetical protein